MNLCWLLINGISYYAEYDFLSRFSKARQIRVSNLVLYIGLNSFLTFIILCTKMPVLPREIIHAVIMYLFICYFFKCKGLESITPVAIIFSLTSFMEGITTVLMRWVAANTTDSMRGSIIQVVLTLALTLVFWIILRYIARWHKFSAIQTLSPYLYLLLLPCTFAVWVVRYGFGLDSISPSAASVPFSGLPLMWALITILGAAVTFLIILKVFEHIVTLSRRETEQALLRNQLKEQRTYLAEAYKREERYRSFQHDIDNHLTVLSGLLGEGNYQDARDYFQKLKLSSSFLPRRVQSGNAVLDVLLGEKIGYAEQNQITVSCHVGLPPWLPADDMDLCVIVSNALDNAIQACLKPEQQQPEIEITIKMRHHFLLIEVTNPTPLTAMPTSGTGLDNIRRTAEKYQGTTEIELTQGRFRLSVLLCLDMTGVSPNTEQI